VSESKLGLGDEEKLCAGKILTLFHFVSSQRSLCDCQIILLGHD